MPANLMTDDSVNQVMGGSQDETLLASGEPFEEQNAVGITDELIEMGADADDLNNEHNLFGSKKKTAAESKAKAAAEAIGEVYTPPAKKKTDWGKTFSDVGAGIGVAKQGVEVAKDVKDLVKGGKKKGSTPKVQDDAPVSEGGIPTWIWIGGGVLVVGIIGIIIWKVRQNNG